MKIEYNNLYKHFVFTTSGRQFMIPEKNRIRIEKYVTGKFSWQQSASAFSVSKSDIHKVCKYILNQSDHHRKVSFAEEYDQFLKYYQEKLKE